MVEAHMYGEYKEALPPEPMIRNSGLSLRRKV